ncbi:SH3-containing GRB2-like protein 3-interacting protein 1 isoform X3 [Clupea harengus]|uniref:SH3-containing GRB2-like protein 3-interacting protein 1 isoform X3 n=1 Tax=Clupea harengus TaxID=7950 RepID=A0A6P8G6H8_CLUHA|nr:SH3-containing GRB2-like protein 3-interacting protein 1 isoform X3 [Clupea harengus]
MAEQLVTGWFRIVAGSLEIEECKSAIMMEGFKKRTRKAFGIRKKEKDSDSTGSPDREGGPQKKTNGAPNGFSGEIDWDRYNSPDIDDEGYSLRPEEESSTSPKVKTTHFFSSSESEGEEDHRPKFKIKIKPLAADKPDYASPSVDELKASIGNIALSPSPMRSSPRRSPGLLKRNTSSEEIARPRRSAPSVPPAPAAAPVVAPAAAPVVAPVVAPEVTPSSSPAPTPPPEPPSSKKPSVPEDATALFGPPLDTAFDEIKSEAVLDESDVWGAPVSVPESHPDSSLARPFPTGTPPPLPPKNVPTSPPPCGSPPADITDVSREEEGSRKLSIADLDNIFGPEDDSKPGEEDVDQWVCFSDESSAPPGEPAPPLPISPPPPVEPAPPLPTSPPPVSDAPAPLPLRTTPPPAEEPCPLSPPPVQSPPKETVPPLPSAQTPPKDTAPSAVPPPPEDPAPPPPPPEDIALLSPPPSPPPPFAESPPLKTPPCLPPDPFSEAGAGADSGTSPPVSLETAACAIPPPPLVLSQEELKSPEGNQQKDDLRETSVSPKDVGGQGSRATPPPPPPPTYRAVVSSPGPCPAAGGTGSGSSSPARPATPSASTSSPTPPPPPPRPPSRPKLPPGKPSVGDGNRPFSPPIHSSSPPPLAPLARAESTSSISSTNSLSAATTPTVGKELSVSVSEDDAYVDKLPNFEKRVDVLAENDQPSLVWFDRGKFYLTFEGCSRGPSPLTMGAQDTLPVAAAFTETVNAYFKGADPSKCVVKITGEMVLSFPAGITRHFANNTAPAVLTFSITNYNRLEHVLPNPQLLCCDTAQSNPTSKEFWVNMPNLMTHLKKVSEQKPQATYYNVDMLKYQVSAQGLQSTPLSLATSWRCEPTSTDLRIDYKYNGDAMTTPAALNNVQFLIPVDGGVSKLQAVLPPAAWNAEQQRILWKIPDISLRAENGGVGSLLARFQLTEGPSKPAPLALQFTSEGSNLSGCDIKLVGPGYRFSLIKKRFAAGKYLAD